MPTISSPIDGQARHRSAMAPLAMWENHLFVDVAFIVVASAAGMLDALVAVDEYGSVCGAWNWRENWRGRRQGCEVAGLSVALNVRCIRDSAAPPAPPVG